MKEIRSNLNLGFGLIILLTKESQLYTNQKVFNPKISNDVCNLFTTILILSGTCILNKIKTNKNRICSTFDNRPEEQRHRRRNIEISHRTKYETKDLTSEFDPIRVTQSISHESFDKKIGEKLIEGQNVRYFLKKI